MRKLFDYIIEEAKSKSQRKLFGMALAYKRGELDDNKVSDEIIELSQLPEETLKEYAKTKESKLPEKVDEAKTIQVKRRYGIYDSIDIGNRGPVRDSIIGYLQEIGDCTYDELDDYIAKNNIERGAKTGKNWLRKNAKYFKEFKRDGKRCCKLSILGKRVAKKITKQ